MLRFEAQWLEDQGQLIVFDVPNNMMTGSMLLKEKEEFKKVIDHYQGWAAKNEPATKSNYKVFTRESKLTAPIESEQVSIRMTAHTWMPERLLLLRFGLQDPHAHGRNQPEQENASKSKGVFKAAGAKDGDSYFMQVQEDYEVEQSKQ